MNGLRWTVTAAVPLAGLLLLWNPGEGAEGAKTVGPDAKEWNTVVDKAIHFLKTSQDAEGSWSGKRSPGVTGVVLTGLLKTGRVSPRDPVAAHALKYIESLVNTKAGHIAGKSPVVQLQNYVTCVNVMALVAAHQENKYKRVIGDAAEFLKKLQWDEGHGKSAKDDFYGGFGYDSKSRPDLSNGQFALEALVAAGIPKDDPALKKAMVFVTRCQNLEGEGNDQPWAGKINDGSFIYSPAGGGQSKAGGNAESGFPGYGSMTYAGIKSMIYCGVSRDDPRIKKAYSWIQKHYSVDANPGMPRALGEHGLYYYYNTMAKCLYTLGIDEVVDDQHQKHDWRKDITEALARRQRDDGSWKNDKDPTWMEGDPNLATGFALMALSYCKPKNK
ncbi:MAG TPA: prenyltransferase/squalene oxidase repeat-containing protein [Gemmataceae bacterium]|nr:prenyltransferase/squalene oxidase repeat-containing protein [Gemmataceae bacterium]